MQSRSLIRALRMASVYSFLISGETYVPEEILNGFAADSLKDLVVPIIKNKDELEQILARGLDKMSVERLSFVDRAIMLIIIYEVKYEMLPREVGINEAVNLADNFSETIYHKAKSLVNAVLDKVL